MELKNKNCIIKKIFAFTLAEVLITLGIIGVVAAMTIPTLMTKMQKDATVTKIKKFYSVINQSIRLAIPDYGDPDGWKYPTVSYDYEQNLEFVNTYFAPYMKLSSCKDVTVPHNEAMVGCSMMDGGAVVFSAFPNDNGAGADIHYLPNYDDLNKDGFQYDPRKIFSFTLSRLTHTGNLSETNNKKQNDNYVIPYSLDWDGTIEGLKKPNTLFSCSRSFKSRPAYCAKYIQMSGWKIPNDYPW